MIKIIAYLLKHGWTNAKGSTAGRQKLSWHNWNVTIGPRTVCFYQKGVKPKSYFSKQKSLSHKRFAAQFTYFDTHNVDAILEYIDCLHYDEEKVYKCTQCGGNAFVGYGPQTIKTGKNKGQELPGWGGLVQPGERICLVCGKKRGISFFG